jgi:hypothetical protein
MTNPSPPQHEELAPPRTEVAADAATLKGAAPIEGDTVYDRNGHSAEYVAQLGTSHLVRPWVTITSWDGEDTYSEPAGIDVWPEVFLAAPTAVLEAEIVDLQAQIDAKRLELSVATDEAAGFIRGEKERLSRIKRHEALERLDDFISGKITHVVKRSVGAISVHEFKEVFEPNGRYGRDGLKLLTLFGKPGLGLQWKVNHYSDGSGSDTEVFPCTSREEAVSVATGLIKEAYDTQSGYWLGVAAKSADQLGLQVPNAVRAAAHDYAMAELLKRRDVEQTALTKINADIAALETALAVTEATAPDASPSESPTHNNINNKAQPNG